MTGSLYSFGYQGLKGSTDLALMLEGTGIEAVYDVRLRPWSGNRAFSAATFHTVEDAGFAYAHIGALGNLAYKTGGIQIKDIGAIETVLSDLRWGRTVALMCVCATPDDCHRWTLAEEAIRRMPDLRVVHLTKRGRVAHPTAETAACVCHAQLQPHDRMGQVCPPLAPEPIRLGI